MNRNFNFNSTTKWVHAISVEKYHGKTYPQPHQTHGRPAADIHISKTFTTGPKIAEATYIIRAWKLYEKLQTTKAAVSAP
jgi:hypothetical protein